jgi:hypothetical protein
MRTHDINLPATYLREGWGAGYRSDSAKSATRLFNNRTSFVTGRSPRPGWNAEPSVPSRYRLRASCLDNRYKPRSSAVGRITAPSNAGAQVSSAPWIADKISWHGAYPMQSRLSRKSSRTRSNAVFHQGTTPAPALASWCRVDRQFNSSNNRRVALREEEGKGGVILCISTLRVRRPALCGGQTL